MDEQGSIIDGDKVMAVCASAMLKRRGKLDGDAVVATVMSNLGLHEFCQEERPSDLVCTDVGDRHVLEKMLERRLLPSAASSRATPSSGSLPPPATAS